MTDQRYAIVYVSDPLNDDSTRVMWIEAEGHIQSTHPSDRTDRYTLPAACRELNRRNDAHYQIRELPLPFQTHHDDGTRFRYYGTKIMKEHGTQSELWGLATSDRRAFLIAGALNARIDSVRGEW